MTPVLWAVVALAVVLLAVIIVVEETRVHEAHREADAWRARTCRHGSTAFAPYDGDEAQR